jgi:hypothetical protein
MELCTEQRWNQGRRIFLKRCCISDRFYRSYEHGVSHNVTVVIGLTFTVYSKMAPQRCGIKSRYRKPRQITSRNDSPSNTPLMMAPRGKNQIIYRCVSCYRPIPLQLYYCNNTISVGTVLQWLSSGYSTM